MAWIYLVASEESVSHSTNGLEQSLTVNETDTLKLCSCREWHQEISTKHQSGMMSERSQDQCCHQSILSLEDSLARTSVLLGLVKAWQENEAYFFSRSSDSLARFDQPSYSWRMYQLSLFEDLTEYVWNSLRSGMIVDGKLYQLNQLELVTQEIDGSCLPTPTVFGNHNKKGASKTSGNGLATVAKMLPTVTASSYGSNLTKGQVIRRKSLNSMATKGLLPTPLARDSKGPAGKNRKSPNLPDMVSGILNPQFVEEIMGFSIGWTELNVLATQWFRYKSRRRSRG